MTERYKRALERAKKEKLEVLTTWHYFQMKKDPFLTPLEKGDTDYFVGRENVVEDIVFQIGVAARGIPMTILLVGPQGSGKTSIINYVKNIIEKIGKESKGEYALSGEVSSAEYLFALPDEIDDENLATQPWLTKAGTTRDFILVDDTKPKHIETINREFVKSKLKLFSLSPLDLDEVLNSLNFTPKVIFLRPLPFEDSVKMLKKRIQITLEKLDSDFAIEHLFKISALRIIWECSMGIPYLMLQNSSKALELVADLKANIVTEDLAKKACLSTKSLKVSEAVKEITKIKNDLFVKVIETGLSPTELSSILQKDRTTISRQLNELKRQGIVEAKYVGRETLFQATLPARIAYELSKVPEVDSDA